VAKSNYKLDCSLLILQEEAMKSFDRSKERRTTPNDDVVYSKNKLTELMTR
jgi:hypothetical protein